VAVIGGGAVGAEFAYWYNAFGSRTTVIEIADQLLPPTDREIADLLAKSFKRQGITTLTSARVESAVNRGDGVMLGVRTGNETKSIEASMVLVAVGRAATVQGAQGMVQWIAGTQMLRLTWRAGTGRIETSVSIVDGPVLDGWNLGETAPARIAKPRPPG
jgi:thioredoxin reductase